MSKEIKISANKKLKLQNVIKKELLNITMNQMDNEIQIFQNIVLSQNLGIYGPLIIQNSGEKYDEDGIMRINICIMIQAKQYKSMEGIMKIEDEHICEHCVFAHYEDDDKHIQQLYNKMNLFIYENELIETGVSYTLYLSNNPNDMVIDIFKQVVAV